MNDFGNGLYIATFGVLFKFAFMGVFILIVIALKRIFPYKPEGDEGVNGENEENNVVEHTASISLNGNADEKEVIAAITAALTFLHSRQRSSLGQTLKECRGSWWNVSRLNYQRSSISQRR